MRHTISQLRIPGMLSALWGFRYFISSAIRGEFQRRFARSKLGAMWSILHPLAQATIFAVALSEVLAARLPGEPNKAAYAIFLIAGTAAWSLFSEIVNRSMNVFIEYASAIKKIAFPRMCLPIIVGGVALINHILLLLASIVVFLFFKHFPGGAWLVLPAGALLVVVFAFGLGVLLGIFNVFVRDVGQVFSIVIQLWFWLTPIIYPTSVLPERFHWLVAINPMAPMVKIYQDVMLYNTMPDLETLVFPAVIAFVLFALAFMVFRRAGADMVDAL